MTVTQSIADHATVADARALFEEARRRRQQRRRRWGLVVLVVVLVVIGLVVGGGSGSKRPPSSLSHHPSGAGSTGSRKTKVGRVAPSPAASGVYEAGQTGPESGWAMSGETLYLTNDTGSTWRAADLPSYFTGRSVSELAVHVVSEGDSDVWISVGDVIGAVPITQVVGGSVREAGIIDSSDGGGSWSFVSLPGCPQSCGAPSISFVDSLHGFASDVHNQAMQTMLFSTRDGGATWQEVSVLPDGFAGAPITFTSLRDGWVVTDPVADYRTLTHSGNGLERTTDGGLTWQTVPGLPADAMFETPTFFGTDDGVMVSYGPSPTVLSTTDGGATWSSHPLPGPAPDPTMPLSAYQPIPFSAPTPTTWFALTSNALIETTDGGAHWYTVTTQISADTGIGQSLFFFSPTDGWAIAPVRGCVSLSCATDLTETHDGGHTWTVVSP